MSGGVWVFPSKDSAICAHAHNVFVPRADLESGDAATVTLANVSHLTLVIVPHLHQVVVTACVGHKGGQRVTWSPGAFERATYFLFMEKIQRNVLALEWEKGAIQGPEHYGCKDFFPLELVTVSVWDQQCLA